MYLEGVLSVSGGYLQGIKRVSGEQKEDVRKVSKCFLTQNIFDYIIFWDPKLF